MADTLDPLVRDLVEWIAKEPCSHAEVIETWRTSCPRLTVWEEAIDRGYVAREFVPGPRRDDCRHAGGTSTIAPAWCRNAGPHRTRISVVMA